jgi:hypothetical protein
MGGAGPRLAALLLIAVALPAALPTGLPHDRSSRGAALRNPTVAYRCRTLQGRWRPLFLLRLKIFSLPEFDALLSDLKQGKGLPAPETLVYHPSKYVADARGAGPVPFPAKSPIELERLDEAATVLSEAFRADARVRWAPTLSFPVKVARVHGHVRCCSVAVASRGPGAGEYVQVVVYPGRPVVSKEGHTDASDNYRQVVARKVAKLLREFSDVHDGAHYQVIAGGRGRRQYVLDAHGAQRRRSRSRLTKAARKRLGETGW